MDLDRRLNYTVMKCSFRFLSNQSENSRLDCSSPRDSEYLLLGHLFVDMLVGISDVKKWDGKWGVCRGALCSMLVDPVMLEAASGLLSVVLRRNHPTSLIFDCPYKGGEHNSDANNLIFFHIIYNYCTSSSSHHMQAFTFSISCDGDLTSSPILTRNQWPTQTTHTINRIAFPLPFFAVCNAQLLGAPADATCGAGFISPHDYNGIACMAVLRREEYFAYFSCIPPSQHAPLSPSKPISTPSCPFCDLTPLQC
ncbi:unnamed protein product [Protopolystoma xenopodis]|uniref:Uncharacterized protein n=1 Tax=Protopolystoma xenopodis TaxID=117903 RepID=A0A3S5AGB6_9PLAT|nr:unnamed protein product [Protopolystoma xenopodis]